MNETESISKIRAIVAKHTRGSPFKDDTALVTGGLVDSLAIVDMIQDLETTFGLAIPTSEVEPDDFDSVRKIRETLARFG